MDTSRPCWLLGIAANLMSTGMYFDVAVRDVAMATAAFTLARLTEAGVGTEVTSQVAASSRLASSHKVTA